jgi:Cu(I)/Ag(I) efflux system membrane protein CusA/SilA
VDGRARYTVNVRYARGLRSTPHAIVRQVLVQGAQGPAIPIGQLATVRIARGPATIRTENAQLVNHIYVDTRDSDIGGYVARAQRAVGEQVRMPPGYHAEWSGQFEYMQRAKARMTSLCR